MSQTSNRLLLGIGLAGLILESALNHPALATGKVSLFKVITTKDEIVIGLSHDELSHIEGQDAGGIARQLATQGSMSVWQYGVRRAEAGALVDVPRGFEHRVGPEPYGAVAGVACEVEAGIHERAARSVAAPVRCHEKQAEAGDDIAGRERRVAAAPATK